MQLQMKLRPAAKPIPKTLEKFSYLDEYEFIEHSTMQSFADVFYRYCTEEAKNRFINRWWQFGVKKHYIIFSRKKQIHSWNTTLLEIKKEERAWEIYYEKGCMKSL